jgi:hypothetical protein
MLKDEPGLCSEACPTSYVRSQVINVKFQKGSDIEEDDDPVATTFPALKPEYEVSCISMVRHVSHVQYLIGSLISMSSFHMIQLLPRGYFEVLSKICERPLHFIVHFKKHE